MDIMSVLRQAQELKKNFEQTQAELEQLTVTGSAGGGMVAAEVNGLGHVKRIKIDRSVVNPDDVEMLEDLVLAALNDAVAKASDLSRQAMGGLDLGGLQGLLGS